MSSSSGSSTTTSTTTFQLYFLSSKSLCPRYIRSASDIHRTSGRRRVGGELILLLSLSCAGFVVDFVVLLLLISSQRMFRYRYCTMYNVHPHTNTHATHRQSIIIIIIGWWRCAYKTVFHWQLNTLNSSSVKYNRRCDTRTLQIDFGHIYTATNRQLLSILPIFYVPRSCLLSLPTAAYCRPLDVLLLGLCVCMCMNWIISNYLCHEKA